MKVALSTKNNMITEHFGHCDYFVVYEIDNNEVKGSTLVKNPPHQKGYLPKFLKDQGIDVVIAGGIGQMAVNLLNDLGVKCYMNVQGDVDTVIENFLNHSLENDGKPCTEHHHE
jgi:predicted Fe-Mo cluster-binding NifX family protein